MDTIKAIKAASAALLLGAVLASSIAAQSSDQDTIVTDEDALFGESEEDTDQAETEAAADVDGDESSLVVELQPTEKEIDAILLTSPTVEIGGRYSFSATSNWAWDNAASLFGDFAAPDRNSAGVDLEATLFFDARPDEDIRIFGKVKTAYPFDDADGTRTFDDVFHVEELFSDFHWDERIFFRGGKHTLNWGVGYFFSPADLLNITEIDPEDPDADREGPVSLKMHMPMGVHNLYLYGIANDITRFNEFGAAVKAEFVLGSTETEIGALYMKDAAPSAMLALSSPLGDIDVFGEAVLRYGSDRKFIERSAIAPFFTAAKHDDSFFFNATAGFSFIYPFEKYESTLSLAAQYLYNGEGYADSQVLVDHQAAGLPLLFSEDISLADLMNTGKHYAAANLSWSNLWGSILSARFFWMHNFSDMSGIVNPALSMEFFERVRLDFSVPVNYGDPGAELSPTGNAISLELAVAMGGGSF